MNTMRDLLLFYVKSQTEVQLRFKSEFMANGGPSGGPGKLSLVEVGKEGAVIVPDEEVGAAIVRGDYLFRFAMPIMAGRPGQPPQQGIMPVIFRGEDVLWISSGIELAEQPMIATPGGRRQGGLVVPGS